MTESEAAELDTRRKIKGYPVKSQFSAVGSIKLVLIALGIALVALQVYILQSVTVTIAQGQGHIENVLEAPSNSILTNFQSACHSCAVKEISQLQDSLQSQSKEDVVLLQWFNGLCNGTYLEMGAYDGISMSNSYLFHKEFGWKGVLIELSPVRYSELVVNRPNEIATINAGVCDERRTLHYVNLSKYTATTGIWEFAHPSFREKWWPGLTMSSPEVQEVECIPLSDILTDHLNMSSESTFYF